jgi:ADP-ribosylglycohydrolase
MEGRARGAWLGQIVGDALGTTLEFKTAAEIAGSYPNGLRELVGGGPFRLRPGQVTDDTEMALGLARAIVKHGDYRADAAAAAYVDSCRSEPFDIGATTRQAFGIQGGREGCASPPAR